MVIRVGVEVLLVLLVAAVLLGAAVRAFAGRPLPGASAPAELDVGRTPSLWFTDSRTIGESETEVCIVRVENDTGLVRERRVLRRLRNDDPGYKERLDEAMDAAYEAARVANLNLYRR